MERRKCWEELEEMIWIRKQAMGAMGALGEDDMDRQASIMEASKQWE